MTARTSRDALSPSNSSRVGLIAVLIHGYCDGSGHPDDPCTRYLTLAGLIAPPDAWGRFEREWRATLGEYESPPWHSGDAYGGTGDFAGWSRARFNAVRMALYTRCFETIAWEERFVHASCTVDLEDYGRAVADMPEVADIPPAALCAYWFVNTATSWLPKKEDDPLGKDGELLLFFDRHEPYQNFAQKEWERRKRNRSDIVSRIATAPKAVDHRKVLPIQAADFCAWHTNRGRVNPDNQTAIILSGFAAPRHFMYWNYDRLITAHTNRLAGAADR